MKKMIPETPKSDPLDSQVAECLEEGTPFDPSEWSVEGGCVGRSSLLFFCFGPDARSAAWSEMGIADSGNRSSGLAGFQTLVFPSSAL